MRNPFDGWHLISSHFLFVCVVDRCKTGKKSWSLQALVASFLGKHLDKTVGGVVDVRKVKWNEWPLNEAEVKYAVNDAAATFDVYMMLKDEDTWRARMAEAEKNVARRRKQLEATRVDMDVELAELNAAVNRANGDDDDGSGGRARRARAKCDKVVADLPGVRQPGPFHEEEEEEEEEEGEEEEGEDADELDEATHVAVNNARQTLMQAAIKKVRAYAKDANQVEPLKLSARLSRAHREQVHNVVREFGDALHSCSYGEGDTRYVIVFKVPESARGKSRKARRISLLVYAFRCLCMYSTVPTQLTRKLRVRFRSNHRRPCPTATARGSWAMSSTMMAHPAPPTSRVRPRGSRASGRCAKSGSSGPRRARRKW